MLEKWQIPLDADDWESGWDDVVRFRLRNFRARSFREKVQTMEDMAEVVERFRQLREQRLAKEGAPGSAPPAA